MTEPVKDEIRKAVEELRLDESIIQLLSTKDAEAIVQAVLAQFVTSGSKQWWWENFRLQGTSIHFADQKGYERLPNIVPDPQEKVWLIIEADQLDTNPVYEANVETITAVIGECFFFEYYVVAKDYRWLLCETHHNVVVGIGEEVESNLRRMAA